MARRPLTARFSADTSAFRSELANARAFSSREFGNIARMGTSAFKAIETSSAGSMVATSQNVLRAALMLNTAFKALQAGAILFTAAVAAGTVELARFSMIAERARAADIGTTYFQSFTVAARAFRGELKDLREDLAGIAKATRDTFDGDRAGGVSNRARDMLQERFRGTNDFGSSNAPALFDQARNAEERIKAVLVGLRDMEAAGQRLAAIDMAEKLGMRNLAQQVDLGRTSFAGFLVEVDRLQRTGISDGSIISPELVRMGEQLRNRFSAVGTDLSQNIRPLLDECARLAWALGNGAAWATEQFSSLIGVIGRVVAALRNATVEATALQGAAARAARIQVTTAPAADDAVAQAQAAREAAGRRFQRGTTGQADRLQQERDDEFGREARRGRGLGGLERRIAGADFSAPVPSPRPAVAPGPSTPSAGAKSTDDWAEAYKRLIENMEKANGVARAELATIGLSTAERERATAIAKAEAEARKSGKTLTDEQRSAVARLAEENGRLKDSIKAAEAAQRGFADALQWTGDQFVDLIANGRSLEDVMKGVRAQMIRAAITGQGPFAQLMGFAPPAGAPSGTVGGLMGLFQPQQVAAPMIAGMHQAAQGMQPLMLNSFSQVANDTRGQFGTVFTGLGSLLQMVLSQSIMSAQGTGGLGGLGGLFSMFGGGGGGGAFLSPFALFHAGGTVGGQVSGFAPAALWKSAPRYHSGLKSNELAAILEQGETVLTEKMTDRTGATVQRLAKEAGARPSGFAVGGAPRITINNHGPSQPEVSQNSDGSIDILIPALEAALADRVSRRQGTMWNAQAATMGTPAVGGLRG